MIVVAIGVFAGAVYALGNPATLLITRVNVTDDAQVVFDHWGHQEWFNCTACHPALFSMFEKKGITMDDIGEGRYCGACHNGKVAFTPDDDNVDCEVCHVP